MVSLAAFVFLLVVINNVQSHEDDVHTIQYTKENFAQEIPKQNHFVMFYAPWCGHCKNLAPTWEQLAEMLNEGESNVRIAKVDCTSDGEICSQQDITGYPTLKFYKVGKAVERFHGTRDLPTLTTFITKQLKPEFGGADDLDIAVPELPYELYELSEDNFEDFVSNGKHFIKFYAPWCGHCQKLAPAWEQLAQSLGKDAKVKISKLDCTQYRSVCLRYDVKGYPTLLWIENGKKVDKYQGQRSHEDLKLYVNEMLGADDEVDEATTEEVKPLSSKTVKTAGVIILDADNFHRTIEKGYAFVKFFAPWCGHCKRLAPTWEELAKKFYNASDIFIGKVDCTLEINKQLCSDQEVNGFPSVFLYKDGQRISEYEGSRTLQDLHDFVLQHVASAHDEL